MKLLSSSKAVAVALVMALVLIWAEQAAGHACTRTFFGALVQLIPCRASVAPFSPAPPSEACCLAVKMLGQPCLCVLLNGPPISGIDRDLAVLLPQKCTANFPPCGILS